MEKGLEKISRELQESLKKILRDYAEALFFAVLLALLLRSFVLASYRVTSGSMAPSLVPGDFILGFKLPYGLNLPFSDERVGESRILLGELAVFKCKSGSRVSSCIKRVVGLPGDRIEVKAGQLIRNGDLVRNYGEPDANFETLIVPPGEAFLASDHWGGKLDSFTDGTVPFENFEARAELIWFSKPPGTSGVLWQRLGQRIR